MKTWISRTVAAVTILGLTASSVAYAAPAKQPSGQGLEISPPVIELNADPGQTVTAIIRVRNVTAGPLIAKGKADDFGAGSSEDGKPKILLDEKEATRYSLKYWVAGVPDLKLAPQELKTAVVNIVVPKNAEPGGHFGVIRFTAVPPDLDGTGVSLSASVGTLVLLKVSGAIKDDVSLAELSTSHIKPADPKKPTSVPMFDRQTSFFESGPVGFLVRLRNAGTVHEKATGGITVTDTFGKNVATILVNEKGGNILPDSVRRFEQTLPTKGLFGHYTAKLTMSYLGGQRNIDAVTSFWVIPWKLILIVLIVLVIVVLGLKVALRRYNQHIIRQARRR